MKGFVFDLDNTLFDRYATITKVIVDNFETIRPYINPAYNAEETAAHLCHTESVRLCVTQSWSEMYAALKEEHFFHPENTPHYDVASAFLLGRFQTTAVNYPFIFDLLGEIRARGYKLGVVTNGVAGLQQAKLDLLRLEKCFDAVVITGNFAKEMCGDEKNQRWYKPNPEPFFRAAQLLGEKPEDLYYVGDNPNNDVLASRNAGLVPIWVRSRSPWPLEFAQMPELSVKDISELRRFL